MPAAVSIPRPRKISNCCTATVADPSWMSRLVTIDAARLRLDGLPANLQQKLTAAIDRSQ